MLVDAIAGLQFDVADDRPKSGVVGVTTSPAPRTDDVMVVHGFAHDVRVLAARKVQPFHGSKLGQDVERPKDRGPSDPEATGSRVIDKVRCREVPLATGDQVRHRAACGRRPIASLAERRIES